MSHPIKVRVNPGKIAELAIFICSVSAKLTGAAITEDELNWSGLPAVAHSQMALESQPPSFSPAIPKLSRVAQFVLAKRDDQTFWWIVFGIAGILGPGLLLVRHFYWLARKEHYQFFPVLLIAIGWLISKRFALVPSRERSQIVGKVQFALAMGLLFISAWHHSPWCAALSVFVLGHALIRLSNTNRHVSHAWWLFALLIPLPLRLDHEIVIFLQRVSSRVASRFLDAVGVLHMMNGNVLEFSDRRFFVEEACSGINSVFVLFAATAVYAVWTRLRLIQSAALFAAAVFWSTAMNSVRIAAIGSSHAWFNLDLSSGWPHAFTGLVLYAITLGLMWSAIHAVLFLFSPVSDEGTVFYNESPVIRLTDLWNRLTLPAPPTINTIQNQQQTPPAQLRSILLGCFAVAIVLQMIPHGAASTATAAGLSGVKTFHTNSFGADADWQVKQFETIQRNDPVEQQTWGLNSQVWTFESQFEFSQASFDGPYSAWHDLRACYGGAGWEVIQSLNFGMTQDEQSVDAVVAADLRNSSGEYAYLVFAAFEESGQLLAASSGTELHNVMARLNDRVLPRDKTDVWQFQILTRQSHPFLPVEKELIREAFNKRCQVVLSELRRLP